jgi:hypothetical protein
MTIRELYHTLAVFFPNWDFSRVFCNINIAGRISEAAMGEAAGALHLVLRVKGPKNTDLHSARARTRGKISINLKEINLVLSYVFIFFGFEDVEIYSSSKLS